MQRSLLLLLVLLGGAACWTSDALEGGGKVDHQAAENVIEALKSLNRQGVSTAVSVQRKAQVLAAAFAANTGAFAFSGPAPEPDPIWELLGEHLNNNITVNLLGKALDLLMTNGTIEPESVTLAIHIIGTYISYPGLPPTDTELLPFSSPHACGKKLLGLLWLFKEELANYNYIKVLIGCMEKVIKGPTGPTGFLGSCQPDVPAVMLALASLKCPSEGSLVYPIDNGTSTGTVTCIPSAGDSEDERSPAALLGGALISQLLLSKTLVAENTTKGVLVNRTLARQAKALSFAFVRMAFAVLQTKDYEDCMNNLIAYESRIPNTNAPFTPGQRIGPLYLKMTKEGKATLCSAVAMRVWKPNTLKADQPWASSTMVQAVVNVWLAIGKAMQDKAHVEISSSQRFTLCDTMSQVLRFRGNGTAVYDMFMTDKYQCVLNSDIATCPPADMAPLKDAKWFVRLPDLDPDLGSKYFACKWLINKRLSSSG